MSDLAPASGGHEQRTLSVRPSPLLLLLLVGGGVFFGTLDQTVVVTVLADILKDLQISVTSRLGEASWIVTGYLLGYTVAMPLVGRIADVYGRVRTFVAALGLFVAGSVAVAVAPNLPFLVAARAVQAIGGGGLLPVALAIAADVAGRRRTLVLGALAAANNGSTFIGPIWGAAIAGAWSWRTIFWLNVPIVLPFMVLLPRLARDTRSGIQERVDYPGAILLALGLSAFTFGLTDDGANPRPLVVSVAMVVLGLLVLGVFMRREWRLPRPMIGVRILRMRRVAAAMVVYLLIGGALITALVVMPLMTDVLYNQSTTQGGLNLMRLLLLLPAGGVAGGWLAMHTGNRPAVLLGIALAIAGFIWMRAWPYVPGTDSATPPSTWHMWGALGAIGFGLGLCDGPIVATVIDSVRPYQRATASALLLVLWTIGMIIGLALLASQGLSAFSQKIGGIALDDPNFATLRQGILHHTFNLSFSGAIVALAVAFVAAFGLQGRARELVVTPYEAIGESSE